MGPLPESVFPILGRKRRGCAGGDGFHSWRVQPLRSRLEPTPPNPDVRWFQWHVSRSFLKGQRPVHQPPWQLVLRLVHARLCFPKRGRCHPAEVSVCAPPTYVFPRASSVDGCRSTFRWALCGRTAPPRLLPRWSKRPWAMLVHLERALRLGGRGRSIRPGQCLSQGGRGDASRHQPLNLTQHLTQGQRPAECPRKCGGPWAVLR